MKKIKKHLVFRYVMLIAFMSLLLVQANNFRPDQEVKYLLNAEELLGSEEAAWFQFRDMKFQRSFDQVFEVAIGFLFLMFIVKPIEKIDKWWLLFPLLLIVAGLFGIIQAYVDRFLNPNYMVSFIYTSSNYNLGSLKVRGFFSMIYVILAVGSIYHVEQLIFRKNSPFRAAGFIFWIGVFLIFVVLIAGLALGTYYTALRDLWSLVVPVVIFATAFTTVSAFFIDSFIMADQFSFKRSTNKFLRVLASALGLLGMLVMLIVNDPGLDRIVDDFFFRIQVFSGLIVLVICAITYLLYLANLGNARSTFKLKADLQKQGSELNFLKSQVNPHFLFNSLNTLYGIALQEESLRTADGIQKLSEMMRFMLRENTADKIPVSREINYINNYIDLQSLRVSGGNDIALNIDIAEACPNQIAPMLLIPFIENAFKHGVSMQEASWIKVRLTCDTQSLRLEVENTRHDHQTKKFEESGIGIENVKKRLEILYPDAYELTIDEQDETYKTILKIWLI